MIQHKHSPTEHLQLAALAVLVGALGAYAAIAFRMAIGAVQWIGFGHFEETLTSHAASLPAWQIVAVPTVGGLVVGGLLWMLRPDRRAHAVQDVIEAASLRHGKMSMRDGFTSSLISAVSLGFGSSTGREGPVVQLGAALAGGLARRMNMNGADARILLGAGVSAAVAASFNAPLAGALFALEVVLGHYSWRAFAPITLASVTGTVVCRTHIGQEPAFVIPDYSVAGVTEYPLFLLLGLLAGVIAHLTIRTVVAAQDRADASPIPIALRPMLGGLLIGISALWLPHLLGVGYEATDMALKEQLPLWLMLVLIFAKMGATAVSMAARFGGGIFSPALFIGAMLGGAFGLIATDILPSVAHSQGLFALVGMGAVAGAVLGAPISTILIVFELTGDYPTATALMVGTVSASVMAQMLGSKSFFFKQLERKGLNLESGFALRLAQALSVRSAMQDAPAIVDASLQGHDAEAAIEKLEGANLILTHNEQDNSFGHLSLLRVRTLMMGQVNLPELGSLAAALPPLHRDQSLESAIEILRSGDHAFLPVIDGNGDLCGLCYAHKALYIYSQALVEGEREAAGS